MKSKTHEIRIKVRFDAPLTSTEAKYAVWNAIHDQQLYGDGKPDALDKACGFRSNEPYNTGRITVPRR